MSLLVYVLCLLTSATCAGLLLRGYARSGTRLLLWSGLCFCGMALNNLLLIVDLHLVRQHDLSVIRALPAVIGMCLLLFGLVWETKR